MKIGITSDHRGYTLKEKLKKELLKINYELEDYGTSSEESVDYPDYAFKLCNDIITNKITYGIAICGSGIGISIACNKVKGIRCAKVSNVEEAIATRIDNDANVVAFGEKTPLELALKIITTFVSTKASQEEKHVRRRNKIKAYEDSNV